MDPLALRWMCHDCSIHMFFPALYATAPAQQHFFQHMHQVVLLMDSFALLPDSRDRSPGLVMTAPVLELPSEDGSASATFGVLLRKPGTNQIRSLTSLVSASEEIEQTVRSSTGMAGGASLQDIVASLNALRGNQGTPNAASGILLLIKELPITMW